MIMVDDSDPSALWDLLPKVPLEEPPQKEEEEEGEQVGSLADLVGKPQWVYDVQGSEASSFVVLRGEVLSVRAKPGRFNPQHLDIYVEVRWVDVELALPGTTVCIQPTVSVTKRMDHMHKERDGAIREFEAKIEGYARRLQEKARLLRAQAAQILQQADQDDVEAAFLRTQL